MAKLLVFGQTGLRFPENAQQFRPFCTEAIRILDRITKYANTCLNPFGRNSAKVILHSLDQEIRSLCKTGRLNKRAKSLLSAFKCANQGKSKFHKTCYLTLIDKFMGTMNAHVQMRIPITCWLVYALFYTESEYNYKNNL